MYKKRNLHQIIEKQLAVIIAGLRQYLKLSWHANIGKHITNKEYKEF